MQIEVLSNHQLHLVIDALPDVVQNLADRWWVLCVYERRGLATSDSPVAIVPNERFIALRLGTGIINADEIHLPLTRRLELTLAHRDSLPPEFLVSRDSTVAGSAATARYTNSWMTTNARRVLFQHPDDHPLRGLDQALHRTSEVEPVNNVWSFMAPRRPSGASRRRDPTT